MRLFHRHKLVCRQAVELVTDYLDGALSRADRARFEVHIADCPSCRTYLEQIRMTIAATGAIEAEALDRHVQDELIALYRNWRAS